MSTWCFKSTTQYLCDPDTAPHYWYWQIDPRHSLIAVTSPRLFATLEQCIVDARRNGFRGAVDLPEELEHPAMIECNSRRYVHAIAQRSLRGRAALRVN